MGTAINLPVLQSFCGDVLAKVGGHADKRHARLNRHSTIQG
jgi:hypothetical protein